MSENEKNQIELKTVKYIKEANEPQRRYVRKDMHKIKDRGLKIQSTLLEYGFKSLLAKPSAETIQSNQAGGKAVPANLKQAQEQQQQQQAAERQAEDEQVKKLLKGMSENDQKGVSSK